MTRRKAGFRKVVLTTNERTSTLPGRQWTRFLEDRRAAHDGRTWIFCDGSSRGPHAAVLVHDRGKVVRRLLRHHDPDATLNVGAEVDAVLLGLEHAPERSSVVVVSDFLNVSAWLAGHWEAREPLVVERLAVAHRTVAERRLDVELVHHAGHQQDDSDMTRWNAEADRLCSGKKGARAEKNDRGQGSRAGPASRKTRRMTPDEIARALGADMRLPLGRSAPLANATLLYVERRARAARKSQKKADVR